MNQSARKPQSQNSESGQNPTELPVGEILRRTRLHYNRSLEEVEVALRIQAKQLVAIEQGDNNALPPRVYAIGFVRSYAEYLGLDGEKIVELFKKQNGVSKPVVQLETVQSKHQINKKPIIIALVIALVLAGSLITVFAGPKDEPNADISEPKTIVQNVEKTKTAKIDEVPEVPTELKADTLKEKQRIVSKKPAEPKPEPAAKKPDGIVLKLVSNSWVEIRDKNRRKLISRVLKAGDQYFVPDRMGLTISIGNAGGVQISIDGDPLQDLGETGQVIRNIALSRDALLQRFPKVPKEDIHANTANNAQNTLEQNVKTQ